MKKLIIATLGGITLLASQASMAAGTDITSGAEIVPATDCVLLAERVTLTLSNNVFGSYQCDEADTEIRVATCHQAGSRQTNDYPCTGVDLPVAGCTATVGDTYTIDADYRAFTGLSTGGTVAPQALGGNCTQAAVGAVEIFD